MPNQKSKKCLIKNETKFCTDSKQKSWKNFESTEYHCSLGRYQKNFLALVQTKIRACFFAFRNFTMLQKQLKRRLQADRTNIVAIIDINDLKI